MLLKDPLHWPPHGIKSRRTDTYKWKIYIKSDFESCDIGRRDCRGNGTGQTNERIWQKKKSA
jgi:hypothetical protein